MNGFRLTVLFSITTIILLSNSVVSRLIPIKNSWKVSDNTILECKVFNGAISKCHVKYEPANIYKFTRNTLPGSSFKPITTSITTLMPSKEQSNRGGWRYKPRGPRDREDHHNIHRHHTIKHLKPKEIIQPTSPRTDYNIVYCKCFDFFCKLDKFIGSHLNKCNKHEKGIIQKLPGAIKNGVSKVFDTVVAVGKPLVNIAVKIAKSISPVIRGAYKVGKIIYKGLSRATKAVTSVISKVGTAISNVGKKVLGWFF